ncbi:HTH_Tnp_Tc3_2 domain-containing protein [Trichonephila clavipes]|nr:HTH_Tnp_Tc3_2 domain-containing protein [Trichonephila clavipes]
MSEKSRLHVSLRWRVARWMEMRLSQADAASSLNVSCSVVHRLWNQCQTESSVSRRHVPGPPQATTSAGERFIALSARRRRRIPVPQLDADHFVALGRRISASMVRRRLHNSGLYARRPVVCVPFNRRQRMALLSRAREHGFWTRQRWASVLLADNSNSHWREIQDVCSSAGNGAPDIINPILLKITVTEVVKSCFRQGSHSVVTLTCMCSREEL